MRRTNTFDVAPQSDADDELLRRVLDASASLWNQITFARRQQFFDGESVWDADTNSIRGRYKAVLGTAAAKETQRKNDEAWKAFFDSDEDAGLPGYWGNEEDGRELRWYSRCDMYTIETGDRSRLEIPVGSALKDEYGLGYHDRLRLEIQGEPTWNGENCRLELQYDETADQYRAFQAVEVDDSSPRLTTPLASEEAALDIGANNLVACTTTTGTQLLYEGRDLFERFRETTERIADAQAKLPEDRHSSKRIRRMYRKRTNRRNHAGDALARDLIERLHGEGVETVYVGKLAGVLETHWSATVNEKTHQFWAYRQFIDRLTHTAEEYGMTVEEDSEAHTSQECPHCGSTEKTNRHRDTLVCSCGFEGHADLTASRTFLHRQLTDQQVGLMAEPVRLTWNDHSWSASPRACSNEDRTDRSIPTSGKKLASVGDRHDARPPARGIPWL